ncbi:MAG: hypothetical protein OXU20_02145 [Myxococcales bacterium]|nr:hypothetical protein [Myxococcales bacterium]
MTRVGQVLLWWSLLATAACDDLDDFRTSEREVFLGPVVGAQPEDAGTGQTQQPFLLYGFDTALQMELRFDPSIAGSVKADRSPGTIDTYTCAAGTPTRCGAEDRVPGPLRMAPLQPIAGLAEDVLARYDFPGPGRVQNYMFYAAVHQGATAGHAMVFVSLMESGRVEVRVAAPAVDRAGPLFGIFRLERTEL